MNEKYDLILPDLVGIKCRCGEFIPKEKLSCQPLIEMYHEKNKGKSYSDKNLYITEYEKCPFCKRTVFIDGKHISGELIYE